MSTMSKNDTTATGNVMEKLISLCKRRGFVYQGSEIYGGLAGTYDYGPLGVALKNNIQSMWWKRFVLDREDMYGLDAAILMNQEVWKASGHVGGFSDPLVECLNKDCKNKRHRVDQLVDESKYMSILDKLDKPLINKLISGVHGLFKKNTQQVDELYDGEKFVLTAKETEDQIKEFKQYTGILAQVYLNDNKIKCPSCGDVNWGIPKRFNMMLKTNVGANEDTSSISYLRPETAQGIFVNFKNVVDSFHPKLPFGIAQIGKAFRNEIAPRDFIFRVRELEQMEIEYFVRPEQWEEQFEALYKEQQAFLTDDIGLNTSKLHKIIVPDADRAHYSKHSIDTEFDFPFGQKELLGLAYRTDFDLSAHMNASKVDISYFDESETDPEKKRLVPHCIEPTFGVGRLFLATLADAYCEDELGGEPRTFLKLSPKVAPVLVAVSPLLKNKSQLVEKAREVYNTLRKAFPGRVVFDDNGNVGKRYRRQDEIGTPFCVVIDFDTVEGGSNEGEAINDGSGENAKKTSADKKDTVTIRHRDTGEQERLLIKELVDFLRKRVE